MKQEQDGVDGSKSDHDSGGGSPAVSLALAVNSTMRAASIGPRHPRNVTFQPSLASAQLSWPTCLVIVFTDYFTFVILRWCMHLSLI